MTVKELIDMLKALDQDAKIMAYCKYGWRCAQDPAHIWDRYGYEDIYKIDRPNDADGAYAIYFD